MNESQPEADPTNTIHDSVASNALVHTLNAIGDPWTLQILKEAFLGVDRFQDFQKGLCIPRQTLILRLNQLCEDAVLYKRPHEERRVAFAYKLTPKGRDLFPFILAVWRWHHRWDSGAGMLPMHLRHLTCGAPLDPRFICLDCREVVSACNILPCKGAKVDAVDLQSRKSRVPSESKDLDNLAAFMIGDRWTILIIHAIMRGVSNYDQLAGRLGISSGVLASRLKKLVALELVDSEKPESDRRQILYSLTAKGLDVYPMINSLAEWGNRWLTGASGPSEILRHADCGHILRPEVVCGACDHPLRAWEIGA